MSRIEDLLVQYENKLVFVEERKVGFESIKELVDLLEEPIEKLTRPHLKSLIGENIHSKEPANTKGLNIKLYKVLENEKSAIYYDFLEKMTIFKFPEPIYFWDKAIYAVVKDDRDIIALDNSPLVYDYKVNQGITDKDYRDRNDTLLLYLEVFDMYFG